MIALGIALSMKSQKYKNLSYKSIIVIKLKLTKVITKVNSKIVVLVSIQIYKMHLACP